MTESYRMRRATLEDAELIMRQRNGMFAAMGVDAGKIETWAAPFLEWVRERLSSGEYLGWLALSEDGAVVAGAGMLVHEWIPSPLYGGTRRGYLLNVFTEPEHRRQGLAQRLVKEALSYCREQGIPTAVLHASDEGRPIYEALGFMLTNEMRLRLE